MDTLGISRLKAFARKTLVFEWPTILLVGFLTCSIALLGLATPAITRLIVDVAIPSRDGAKVVGYAVLLALLPALARLVGTAIVLLRMQLDNRIRLELSLNVYRAIMDGGLIDRNRTRGEVLTLLGSDTSSLASGVLSTFFSLLEAVCTVVGAFLLIASVSPVLLAGAIISGIVRLPLLRYRGHLAKRGLSLQQRARAEMASNITGTLEGYRVVRNYELENWRQQTYADLLSNIFGVTMSIERRLQFTQVWESLLGNAVPALTYGYGGMLVIQGRISVGVLIASIQYLSKGISAIMSITSLYSQIKPLEAHVERIARVLSTPSDDRPGVRIELSTQEELTLSRVLYRYPDSGRNAVGSVSLVLRRGVVTCLVGESGCGKTTLGYIICCLLMPQEGLVTTGAVCVSTDVDTRHWRSQSAIVSNNEWFFDASIRVNLQVLSPHADEQEMWDALHLACADSFVRQLPQGIDTPIGPAGFGLSAGETQRLSIARAVLRNPQIIVFDEVTSHLDSETEQRVMANLIPWARQRITLFISHRQSTTSWADRVVEMNQCSSVEEEEPMTL